MRRRTGRLTSATTARTATRTLPSRTLSTTALAAAAVFALGAALLSPPSRAAAADPDSRPVAVPVADHCASQCDDILPPGENGNATLAEILGNILFGTHPAHSSDQLARYDALVAYRNTLTDSTLTTFFNDASFGVPANQVESVTTPRPDVTITRDKQTGVPHIKGTTRYGTEFGAGFAAGQDRLWMMDLFRHIGRGELTSFMRRRARQPGAGAAVLALGPVHGSRPPVPGRPHQDHRGRARRAGHGRRAGVRRRHQRLPPEGQGRPLLPR